MTKNIKGSKGEENYLQRNPYQAFSRWAETLHARREWDDIFQILKDKKFEPRTLYPVKPSFRYDGDIKAFPDKQKLREFIATIPPLQEMIKEALIPETKRQSFEQGDK
uniref:L1 transposable element dsRBD-like domain-containing protein n=1 Tax=Equus caballus TaxID=9796 RepID=A0A9L0RJQ1_HORSE